MNKNVRLDTENVVVAGHSMGGATAIRVGCSNPKVKCILTKDPWLFPLHKDIYTYKLKGLTQDKSMMFINTESFHDFTP